MTLLVFSLIAEELRKTLVALWHEGKSSISPDALFHVIWKVVPRFRGYHQQDAHEFLRYLLDRLHTELLTLLPYCTGENGIFIGEKSKSTIVTSIFGGILQSDVRCLVCGTTSTKFDPFLDLSLDIPTQFTGRTTKQKDGIATVCKLSDCLKSFTDIEELADSELYTCNECHKRQHSSKKFWIKSLPNVLCLHLKRFRWTSNWRIKLETFVEFPERDLDMSPHILSTGHHTRNISGECTYYDLAAVIVHHGSGAGCGHYTSYAINDGVWYHFNDSTVTVCDSESIVTKSKAYILFYVRQEFKLPAFFTSPEERSLRRNRPEK